MQWLLYAFSLAVLVLLVDYFVTRRIIPKDRPFCPMLIILSGAVSGFWSSYLRSGGDETFGRIAVLFFAAAAVIVLLHGFVQYRRSRRNVQAEKEPPNVTE